MAFFQTKVDPEYLERIRSKSLQEQWLESQLAELDRRISHFRQVLAADQANVLAITSAAIECLVLLKTSLLEPFSYERLYVRMVAFLEEIKTYYNSITADPLKRVLSPYQLYVFVQKSTFVLPRLYLQVIAASIWLEHINEARKRLEEDPEKAPTELRNQGLPETYEELRSLRQNITSDIHEFCRCVQDPLRHLFLRNFMYESIRPYLDFDITNKFVIVADIDITLRFMLSNYVEMNRFWARTAFEPARTRQEGERRDKKRKYLADMISKGFVEVARLCTIEGLEADIMMEVLKQVELCSDEMARSTMLEGVCANLSGVKLFGAIEDVLPAVSHSTTGVKSFILLVDNISADADKLNLTEEFYTRLCEAGLGLSNIVLRDIAQFGIEKVDKLTGMETDSAWISCINALLLYSSRVWNEDLNRLVEALNVLIRIIFPNCQDSDLVNYATAVENKQVPPFQSVQLMERDDDAIVKTLTLPLRKLRSSLIPTYLNLPQCRALRAYLAQRPEHLIRDFALGVSRALLENPLTLSQEEYVKNIEQAREMGLFCLNATRILAKSDAELFAQVIQTFHAAKECYDMYERKEIAMTEENKIKVLPALFYCLRRDGYLREAMKIAALVDDVKKAVSIKLHIDAATSIAQKISGKFYAEGEYTADDLYTELAAAILAYEQYPDSRGQCEILCDMAGVFSALELPSGEEEAILSRIVALSHNLLVRADRSVALAKCAFVFKRQKMADQAKKLEAQAREAATKWGNEESNKKMEMLLSLE